MLLSFCKQSSGGALDAVVPEHRRHASPGAAPPTPISVPTSRLKTYMEGCYAGCSAVAQHKTQPRGRHQSRNTPPSTPLPRAADAQDAIDDARTNENE